MNSELILPVEQLLFCGDIVKIGRFDCPPGHYCFARTAPLHNNLFVFTHKPLWWRRGEGEYRFVEPGAALLHRAGGEIERRNAGTAGDCSDWFGIRPDVFDEGLQRYRLYDLRVTDKTVALLTEPRFRLFVNQLVSSLQFSHESPLAVEEAVLVLFDRVCAGLSVSAKPAQPVGACRSRRRRLADRARVLLDDLEHSASCAEKNMRLEDIARSLGASVYHLCRVFRAECGLSMHAYRQRQRLGRAIELLQASHQDLTTLAFELGYSSHSHFSRVFRQHVGCPPSICNTA